MKITRTGSFLIALGVCLQATGWAQAQCGGAQAPKPAKSVKSAGSCGKSTAAPKSVKSSTPAQSSTPVNTAASCSAVTPRAPVMVTLVKIVDSEGKIDSLTCKDEAAVDRKRTELTAQYEKAVAWRKQTDTAFEKQGLKNERPVPVQPILEVVKADIPKSEATAIIKDAKDWAVYEITTDATVKRVLAYADSDVFARALADAEYARAYNQWVKDGKKDGAEPKPSTVIKVGEAGSKMQAQKALSAKPAVCSTK